MELTKSQAGIVAQLYASLCDSVRAFCLIAHNIQTLLDAVVVVAEQQRIFVVNENALASEVVLQDRDTSSVDRIHRSVWTISLIGLTLSTLGTSEPAPCVNCMPTLVSSTAAEPST